jgi:uncharacterized surface protein with fasciclin (FAS1) repeats
LGVGLRTALEIVEEQNVKTRISRALGVSAAVAAIAASVPIAITAQADPTTTPAPVVAQPQGNCDPVKAELATAGLDLTSLSTMPLGKALASIPSLSTFNAALSGGWNPEVNVIPVLENGPYVVFAPTNEAFAALDPAQVANLKSDPAALYKLDYYHAFLGLLGPGDVEGQRPTQQGADVKVKGKDGDIKVNDDTKVICGGIQTSNARIYIVDHVLNPDAPPAPLTPKTSFDNTGKPATPAAPTPTSSPAPAG